MIKNISWVVFFVIMLIINTLILVSFLFLAWNSLLVTEVGYATTEQVWVQLSSWAGSFIMSIPIMCIASVLLYVIKEWIIYIVTNIFKR